MKDISNIIREFDKLPYERYEMRGIKHDLTDSYFYPERHLEKCMTRADALNSHVYPIILELTGMKQIIISHICST